MVFCSLSSSCLLIFLHVKIKLALAHLGSLAIKSYTIQILCEPKLLFPLLHNPHFDAPSFLTLFIFLMLCPPWKENFSVRNAPSATDASFVLVAGYSLIYRVVHLPFTLERSFSFVINSPQAFYMLA